MCASISSPHDEDVARIKSLGFTGVSHGIKQSRLGGSFGGSGASCGGGTRADGFYCGDDEAEKAKIKPLIADIGLNPVDVGPLRNARLLESLAMLWIDLAINQGWGAKHVFKLLRR